MSTTRRMKRRSTNRYLREARRHEKMVASRMARGFGPWDFLPLNLSRMSVNVALFTLRLWSDGRPPPCRSDLRAAKMELLRG